MSYKLLLYRDEAYPDSHIADRYPAALKAMLPDVEVVLARTRAEADAHIADADAAFGNLPPDLFVRGKRLRWIQGPQAGPDPSFYHPALVASDVVVTNMRGIFNDHISAHIMAMVLAFARGLPRYWTQQARREWTDRRADVLPARVHGHDPGGWRNRRRDRAAVRRVRYAGDRSRSAGDVAADRRGRTGAAGEMNDVLARAATL